MNTPGIFIVGIVVTLLVGSAILALVYAAVLDGRDTTVADAEAAGLIGPPDAAPAATPTVSRRR